MMNHTLLQKYPIQERLATEWSKKEKLQLSLMGLNSMLTYIPVSFLFSFNFRVRVRVKNRVRVSFRVRVRVRVRDR